VDAGALAAVNQAQTCGKRGQAPLRGQMTLAGKFSASPI